MTYPPALQEIIDFFEPLEEGDRREALLTYAATADQYGPESDQAYVVAEVRKDAECLDEVGIFLSLNAKPSATNGVEVRMQLGRGVQTLTRALTAILCRGLNGASPRVVATLPDDFVAAIVGANLMRQRSRTVYYVLNRLREAAGHLVNAS